MTGILKKQKTEKKMSIRYFEGLNLWILAAVFVANIFFQLSEVSSSLFLYPGTFVLIGMLFLLDKDEYIYLTVSLLSVLRFSQIFNVSVINIITFVYFAKAYVFENEYKKEKEKRQLPRRVVLSGVVFILFCLIFILRDTQGFRMSLAAIKLMFLFIYIVDVFRNMKNEKEADKKFMNIQVYYVAGVLIAIFVALIFNPKYSIEATRMALSEGAVNNLGISLASCLAFVTIGITKVTNFKEWSVLSITALPLLYFCFATQSRTCILGMIFIFSTTFVFGCFRKESRVWVILMLVACVVVLGALVLFFEDTQIHKNVMETIERFINPKNDDITNGRFDIWKMYYEKISNSTELFFIGGKLKDYNGRPAHNIFIEVFANYGFFGTAIIGWLYISVFCEIKAAIVNVRKSRVRMLGFVPLALVFFLGMGSHSLLHTEPTINFCLGAAMIYFYGESEETENGLTDNKKQSEDLNRLSKKQKTFRSRNLQSRWV